MKIHGKLTAIVAALIAMPMLSTGLPAKDAAPYNPSLATGKVETQLLDMQYKGRKVPLKVYLPAQKNAPVILLSHGLGGSREVGAYLGNHWAGQGYAVVAMQHIGSDTSVIKDAPRAQRFRALKQAASFKSFTDRTKDVPAVIDQITQWNADKGHLLSGRLDLSKLGVGGHSFGAITSQAVSGQKYGGLGERFTDKRIKAALMLSPSSAKGGRDKETFGHIQLPWMLMTGTKDTSAVKPDMKAEDRVKVYQALPATGNKYQLVLKDAQHMAFSDRTMLGTQHRNKNHHKAIKALSTAFWDAHLKGDAKAKAWLHGKDPKKRLEASDTWERK
jgi:predicted dienelactone hydrolase